MGDMCCVNFQGIKRNEKSVSSEEVFSFSWFFEAIALVFLCLEAFSFCFSDGVQKRVVFSDFNCYDSHIKSSHKFFHLTYYLKCNEIILSK